MPPSASAHSARSASQISSLSNGDPDARTAGDDLPRAMRRAEGNDDDDDASRAEGRRRDDARAAAASPRSARALVNDDASGMAFASGEAAERRVEEREVARCAGV